MTPPRKSQPSKNRKPKAVLTLEQIVLQTELIRANCLSKLKSGVEKMVVCPKCGSKIEVRKVLLFNNLNPITCSVCSSKLRAKNKRFFYAIGPIGAGVEAIFGVFLLELFFRTGNVVYLGLVGVWFAAVLLTILLLLLKFLKLKVQTEGP